MRFAVLALLVLVGTAFCQVPRNPGEWQVGGPHFETRKIGTVEPGAPRVVSFTKTETTGVKQISILVRNRALSVEINVSKIEQQPAAVTVEIEGQVYHYIEINSTLAESNTQEAEIQFLVNKSWVAQNNASAEDVKLNRFHNSNWAELPTEKISEDEDAFYYESSSPSLSVFVITLPALIETMPDCRTLGCADGYNCTLVNETYQCVLLQPVCNLTCGPDQTFNEENCTCVQIEKPELPMNIILFAAIAVVIISILLFVIFRKR